MRTAKTLASLMFALWLTPVAIQAADTDPAPKFDLLHFWRSDGEQAALKVLADRFVKRGGSWDVSITEDYQHMKYDALMRISNGYPPGAMLWLTGKDIQYLADLNVVRPVDDLIQDTAWKQSLQAFTLQLATTDRQQVIATPITIHNENWAWHNLNVYRKLNLSPPGTWDEFFEQAPVIMNAGYSPIAVGQQDLSIRVLFAMVIAGSANRNDYARLFVEHDASVLDTPSFRKSLSVFARLRGYADTVRRFGSWNHATAAVVHGQAAMQIMGDWAKGEFIAAGKRHGLDFECTTAPDAAGRFVAGVDVFVYPKVVPQEERIAQSLFAEVVLEKDVQLAFARRKGSIPAVTDYDTSLLDPCARKSLPALHDSATRLFAPRHTMEESAETKLRQAVVRFWHHEDANENQLLAKLRMIWHDEKTPNAPQD